MALDRGAGQLKILEETKNSTKPESGVLKMRTKRKINKTAIAMTLAVSAIAGSFATAYAASYNFTLVRGVVSVEDTYVWKPAGATGNVTVGSSSAPSYYTTYMVYTKGNNNDILISRPVEVQNTAGKSGMIIYDRDATGAGQVRLAGCDNRGTAPNYTTVRGNWTP